MSDILSQINTPNDLKKLTIDQLPQLCDELRAFVIQELSVNPGHLASSLGAIELTVALHYVYQTPEDRVVWDVGHQAYAHKILTGRRTLFSTNRKFGGISGFPSPEESIYDTFTAGHASNSISAALGMAVAADIKGEEKRKVIAVIGDAAISGGLAFEGLNNAAEHPNDLLIVLNDNRMAIDKNVGGMSKYLVKITTSQRYNRIRYRLYNLLKKHNVLNERSRTFILRFNNSLKSLLTGQHNIFEGLNIRYFGPTDGHDVVSLVRIFTAIKDMKGPKIVHLITKKGKGYTPAEISAVEWHAPGVFDVNTGERKLRTDEKQPPLFQDVFGNTLVELANTNDRIIGITPAMPTGCSMTYMQEKYPERTFDVGIAEEHAVTFSGGLAKEGLLPFCNIYSSFMQRAFDQVIHDVAIQNLPVTFCLDRAGLVGEDGSTHHGALDLAYMNCIPNMTIASPMDEHYLRHLMYTAQLRAKGPMVLRYPRGRGYHTDWQIPMQELTIGNGRCLVEGNQLAVLTIGPIGNLAEKAIKQAQQEGYSIAHYDMIFLKPIDENILHLVGRKYKQIITIEDGTEKGGLGCTVTQFMNKNNYSVQIHVMALPDRFIPHGTIPELQKYCGIDQEHIYKQIIDIIK